MKKFVSVTLAFVSKNTYTSDHTATVRYNTSNSSMDILVVSAFLRKLHG